MCNKGLRISTSKEDSRGTYQDVMGSWNPPLFNRANLFCAQSWGDSNADLIGVVSGDHMMNQFSKVSQSSEHFISVHCKPKRCKEFMDITVHNVPLPNVPLKWQLRCRDIPEHCLAFEYRKSMVSALLMYQSCSDLLSA